MASIWCPGTVVRMYDLTEISAGGAARFEDDANQNLPHIQVQKAMADTIYMRVKNKVILIEN